MFDDLLVYYVSFSGYFAYLEASGRLPRSYADLALPPVTSTSRHYCLRFYLYMYGEHVGRLEVWRLDHSSKTDQLIFSQALEGGEPTEPSFRFMCVTRLRIALRR